MATSHKVASDAILDPAILRSLPRELQVLVLARLPVPKITRLYCQISKEWTMNMEFNRACDGANPNMAALLIGWARNEFFVKIFDFNKYVWLYEYGFCLTNWGSTASRLDSVWMPLASDGGLVCFVSTWKYTKANPLCILVINPLTQVHHELPPLQHVYTVPPTLVHMKVDSETKGYKVVVVSSNDGRHTIEIYDSVSRQWSQVASSWGCILNYAHNWNFFSDFNFFSSTLCAYNIEEGLLKLFDCELLFQSKGACAIASALVGDRMFVLHEMMNRHNTGSIFNFITEFQFQSSTEEWVPVRIHNQCFSDENDWPLDLHACEDFLMFRKRRYNIDQSWCILNRKTGKSRNLPGNALVDRHGSLMCRVFWNGIP